MDASSALSNGTTPCLAPFCSISSAGRSSFAGPRSHASPGSTTPSPQNGNWHAGEQPSPGIRLPSSHSSTPDQRKPSPHSAGVHPATQASPLDALPSSHPSPGSTIASPQNGTVQLLRQPSKLFPL